MRNDLRNLGLFLITPFPQKFHFEGVDNRRAARQLTLIGSIPTVLILGFFGFHFVKGAIEAHLEATRKPMTAVDADKEQR